MDSALLSVLSVLAALGEVRPLERRSSLGGEALPSGLAVCFFRPLRSVDIWKVGETQKPRVTSRDLSQLLRQTEPGTPERLSLPSRGSVGSSCYASR